MSQEKLHAFAEAVSKSEELQKQFNSIQVEALKSTAEKLAKLSESAGTPFTAEEYLKSVVESSEDLSTEQLRSVAGGINIDDVVGRFLQSFASPGICAVGVPLLSRDKGSLAGLLVEGCE
jgi:predicted ribosomally synthesized peptide with nif11-like leader